MIPKIPAVSRLEAFRYGTVLLVVLAAVFLRLYVVKQSPNSPFIIAVVLIAWYWGFGPGLLAAVLGALANGWMLSSAPLVRGLMETGLGLGFFLAVALGIRKIYEGHKSTAAAVLALKEGLDDRDRKLVVSEENLRDETRKLKAILNSIGEGVVVADASGEFLVFNPAAREILGRDPNDAPVEEWSEYYGLFLPDTATPYPPRDLPLARALRGEAADNVELFVRHEKKPSGIWLSVTARPLRDVRGDSRGAVAVFRDITELKQAEEVQTNAKEAAEHANRTKSEFLSRMSHELRTPLNSILGFAQVLQMGGSLAPREVECVEHILKGGRHLLRMIDEVLDIARIEAGKLPLSVEPVQVSEAISRALEMVRPIAESRGIHLSSSDNAPPSEQHVMADRQRLHQILLNLLSNGIKYNRPNGSVRVSSTTDDGLIRINVADTGQGIAPEDQSRLFSPFERLNAAQTEVEGTGLGLALSKNLIEAMGGTIGMSSRLGEGSTFWIELPAAEAPLERVRRQEGLAVDSRALIPRSLQVLYIEDNMANVQLMEHVFSYRPEVKLLTAMQGRIGLDIALENRPDLILLDLHLPDLRGDAVLRELRADPRTRDIPTVMISADATPREIGRLREAGATDYFTKPIDVQKLLQALDEHLRRAPAAFERTPLGGG